MQSRLTEKELTPKAPDWDAYANAIIDLLLYEPDNPTDKIAIKKAVGYLQCKMKERYGK